MSSCPNAATACGAQAGICERSSIDAARITGETVTAGFGDEPKSARYASPRTTTEDAKRYPCAHAGGANVCAKVAELTHDDCRAGAYPTELIVQKSEQLGLMMNSYGIMKYPALPHPVPQEFRTIIIRLALS